MQDQFPFNINMEDWEHKTGASMQQWLKRNMPFIKHALKFAKVQHIRNASDICQYIPNTPILRMKSHIKVKRRHGKIQSKDIRQFTQDITQQCH
eukprot:scaffold108429_cov91-Attheya_sp.AAC.1